QNRHAGALSNSQAGRRGASLPGLRSGGGRAMTGLQRGGAAIVGAAESDLGQVAEGLNPIDLMAQGIARAVEDAGLRLRDIDGLLCASTQSRTSGLSLSEYLGISPKFIDTTILGG